MPNRHRHRHRTMKGGFLDNLSNTLSGWGSSIGQGASSIWAKTKNATSSLTGSTSSSNTNTSYQAPMTTSTYGGKRSKRRKHMRGGFKDNTPTTGLAVNAASITDIKTAEPKTTVGGRTRRRHRKNKRTRRH